MVMPESMTESNPAFLQSVVRRASGMLKRIGATDPILFAGGVALNPCMVRCLAEATGKEILVPEQPQMTGALGAAIMAEEMR